MKTTKPAQPFADILVAIHLSIHDAVVINSQLMNAKIYLQNAITAAQFNGWNSLASSWSAQLDDLTEATKHYRDQIDKPQFVRVVEADPVVPSPEDHDPTR